jgi:hypothetical protein
MSAKRLSSLGVMIVVLTISLLASGCATTSSQAAKPHKPQIITSETDQEGLKLPDGVADVLSFLGNFVPFFFAADPTFGDH